MLPSPVRELLLILHAMSIKNVKIDLVSAAAIGAFALFLLAPLLA
jgi:hypothetical protein